MESKSGTDTRCVDVSDDTVLKLCLRTKTQPVEELRAFTMAYTQVLTNADKSNIRPEKQGFNRDAAEASVIAPDFAVCCVADGCSLRYWSEVAAKVAVKKFVSYMEKYIWTLERDITVSQLKQLMIDATLYTNQELIDLVHPQTQQRVSLEENGGQTTLTAAVVFPFLPGLWGVIALGMGDSEALLFVRGVDSAKGHWVTLTHDDGKPMLPFTNLRESQVSKPELQIFDKDATVFLFSDGVRSSFPNAELPILPNELEANTWHMCKYLLQTTFESHKQYNTDPDDVCLAAIRPRECSSDQYQYFSKGYPHREPQVDMTELFLSRILQKWIQSKFSNRIS